MDQLFDSLSEDWVSQPRSPQSSKNQSSSPVAKSPSQLSNGSRIPRYQPRTSSRLSSGKTDGQRRNSLAPAKEATKLPLSEKTLSTINTFNSKAHGSTKLKDSGPVSSKAPKQKIERDSTRSLPQDTVQIRPTQSSPMKVQENNGTPDWKRRLKHNSGSGDQQDLFSPIGLENVFKPPTVKSKGEKRKGPRYQPSAIEHIPSSPPQMPRVAHRNSGIHQEEEQKSGLAGSQHPGALIEKSGMIAQEAQIGPSKEIHQRLESRMEQEGTRDGRSQRSSQNSLNEAQHPLNGPQGPLATPKLPSYSQKDRNLDKNQTNPEREEMQMESNISRLDERSRVTSGQTADCNEDLSPFFVSRQHTVDGRVDYAPVVDLEQVRKRMNNLRLRQQDRPSSRSSDKGISYAQIESPTTPLDAQLPANDLTSHSLPEDLSTGTQSFVANGGFVNARRGGRSQEGSFLRRPLSPTSPPNAPVADTGRPISPDQPPMEAKNQQQQHFCEPATPKRQQKHTANSERPTSSGSPLKLFDKYDTFTNDRLQRRMSKFEETVADSAEEGSSIEQIRREDKLVEDEEKTSLLFCRSNKSSNSRVSSFGEGELDDHGFESFPSPPFVLDQQQISDRDRQRSEQKPGDFRFVEPVDKNLETEAFPRLKGLKASRTQDLVKPKDTARHIENEEEDVTHTANGKRLPYSPAKDPKPKRRRTLRSSEEADLESLRARQDSVSTGPPTSSVLGRKRKDALYDSNVQIADPKVLAMRQILRPRNPTPSQGASHNDLVRRQSAAESVSKPKHQHDPAGSENIESETPNPLTQKLAGEIATLALDIAEELPGSPRKPSVNTADFFNEAQQIMQLIRSRGQPVNEAIDEEPTAEPEDEYEESIYPESTKEAFSRPPSREGGSLRKPKEPRKLDARVVSQLRRFEEKTDVGMTLSSSLKSLKIGQPNDTAVTIELKDIARQQGEDMESDLNIRIIERRRRNSSSATTVAALTSDTQAQSTGSHSTSGPSTNQSIPTNSSRGSRNKAVIAPETVAHLLPDQVAGMTFDHERGVWVKSRSSSKTDDQDNRGAESEVTDDELGGIPDLSVDETEELQRIKTARSPLKNVASASHQVSIRDHATSSQELVPAPHSSTEQSSRPATADGRQPNLHDMSSAPSKFSGLASSGLVPETRATSWGGEAFAQKQEQGQPQVVTNLQQNPQDEHAEEVEHEISILEGRVSRRPGPSTPRQPRVVTVAFSSPLVDQVEASYFYNDESQVQQDEDDLNYDESPVRTCSKIRTCSTTRRTSSGFGRKSAHRSSSLNASVGNQPYVARPLSRLDERDEMSMIHLPNASAMNLAMSTPLPTSNRALTVPPTGETSSSVSFQLSPLPEFTVHQVDRPLDKVNAAQPLLLCSSKQVERQVSQATQEMVKKITDVEPYEPYWDYLQALDLHDRNIASLHMLNEFCRRLEELDVSKNQLRELTGAPFTLRNLRGRHNCFSDLTAWNHLYNLQYLDVSSNQLRSLKGFRSLVHLRELRADDNQIDDVQGILELDGLIRLSLRRNRVEGVNLEDCNLRRLTDLDLYGNNLLSITGAHQLRALRHLNLGNNSLSAFVLSSSVPTLETLNLSSNSLTALDLKPLPSLRCLNLDNNSIPEIPSLSSLRSLQSLSWRSQSLPPNLQIDYQSLHNLTHLNLSGNKLSAFAPNSSYFNLRTLELASTGLQTLSEDFGLHCPNLRTLNLNYNALRDLRPLLGIARLEKLYVTDNRIDRLRRTAAVLSHLGKSNTLVEVDLRNNPLTVGFYMSTGDTRIVVSDPVSVHESWNEEEAQAFLLPAMDREADRISRQRLDEDTKLRRRVYEMLAVSACPGLGALDGLEVCAEEVVRQDEVWGRLVELGVLKPKEEEMGMIEGTGA